MPRVPELDPSTAAPVVRKMMEGQEAYFGFALNPTKVLGHCPEIAEGLRDFTARLEEVGRVEGRLRSLLYSRVASLNGCPF